MKSHRLRRVVLIAIFSSGLLVATGAQGMDGETARLQAQLQTKLELIRGNSKAKQALFQQARADSAFCSHCHGVDGNSVMSQIPRLAGQNPVYLLDQIQRFAEGKRKDYIMTGLAGQLSGNAKVAIAAYFSQQKPIIKREPAAPAVLARGSKKYHSICFVCHGPDGKGKQGYARIAGQREQYIINALTDFKYGTGERHSATMSGVTKTLSNADITALAAYVHNMD